MSKIKRSLPEDFSVLQGDELDGSPAAVLLTDVDFAINELHRSLATLRKYIPLLAPYQRELLNYASELGELAEVAGRPFGES